MGARFRLDGRGLLSPENDEGKEALQRDLVAAQLRQQPERAVHQADAGDHDDQHRRDVEQEDDAVARALGQHAREFGQLVRPEKQQH